MKRTHLLLNVVQRIRRVDRETDQDDVRIRVRQRSESIVIFLSGGIPKSELDLLSVHLDIGNAKGKWESDGVRIARKAAKIDQVGLLVLENRRDVNLFQQNKNGKLVR